MTPLVPGGGDAARGAAIAVDRERGHCVLCHRVASLEAPFQGTLGPPLDGVGRRLGEAMLRLRVVDSTRVMADSAMPSYHRTAGLTQVAAEWQGQPVLDAQEVEDVVAWLLTLREAP